MIVHHVVVRESFKTGNAGRRRVWVAATPEGPIPRADWYTTKMVERVKLLDTDGTYPPWTAKATRLEAVRERCWRPPVQLLIRPATQGESLQLKNGQPYAAHHQIIAVGTRSSLGGLDYVHPYAPLPQSTTIIIVTSKCNRRFDFNRILNFVAERLGFALKRDQPWPITMVNLSPWYSIQVDESRPNDSKTIELSRPSLPDSGVLGCTTDDQVRDLLRELITEANARERVDKLLGTLSFLTLAEYREKVGDAQLQMEPR